MSVLGPAAAGPPARLVITAGEPREGEHVRERYADDREPDLKREDDPVPMQRPKLNGGIVIDVEHPRDEGAQHGRADADDKGRERADSLPARQDEASEQPDESADEYRAEITSHLHRCHSPSGHARITRVVPGRKHAQVIGLFRRALRTLMAEMDNRHVSSIIEFFVAPDDAAAAGVAESGPGASFESATYGNFDVWSTLEEWESILTDRSLEELVSGGGNVVAGGDGIPLVLATSRDLTTALADADAHLLSRTAEQWIQLRDEAGETIDSELAQELIREVAALAFDAIRTGSSLYCWIC